MSYIRISRLIWCSLAFFAASIFASDEVCPPGASATIQATATVISPSGLTESRSDATSDELPLDAGWLLYSADPASVLIQVSVDGRLVDEFAASEGVEGCTTSGRSHNSHVQFVSCKRVARALGEGGLACVVTVISTDN